MFYFELLRYLYEGFSAVCVMVVALLLFLEEE